MTSASMLDKRLLGLGSPSENVPGLPVSSATDAIVAKAGGTQATSTLLVSVINRVTVVATAGDGVLLPTAIAGLSLIVANAAGSAPNVFPNLGDAINGLGTNNPFSVPVGKTAEFFSAVAGVWHTILGA